MAKGIMWLIAGVCFAQLLFASDGSTQNIDRHGLVNRHNVTLNAFDKMAPLSVGNGKFTFTVDLTGLQTFPSLYDKGIGLATMAEWGWDYPMIAMCAARLGQGQIAVDAVLKDVTKNTYLPNGHNYQRGNLPIYLPGNGGLLTTVAMMAAGWDGCTDKHAPGFPDDGQWTVRYEGLKKTP
jgi:hypothetical protein